MTQKKLIKAAVKKGVEQQFASSEDLLANILASVEDSPHQKTEKKQGKVIKIKFVAVAAAIATLAAMTAVADSLGLISLDSLLHYSGISQNAFVTQGADVVLPYLENQLERINFIREENSVSLLDVKAVMTDYENGDLSLEEMYEIAGINTLPHDTLEYVTANNTRAIELEKFIADNYDKYIELSQKDSTELSDDEVLYMAEYRVHEQELSSELAEIADNIAVMAMGLGYNADDLSEPPTQYKYPQDTGYTYHTPYTERDSFGEYAFPILDKKSEEGECTYIESTNSYTNINLLYNFLYDIEDEKESYLIIYEPSAVREYTYSGGVIEKKHTYYYPDNTATASVTSIDTITIDEQRNLIEG